VRDDGAAEPRLVDVGSYGIDDTGHLPPRGHRQLRNPERAAGLPAPQAGVEQVDAGRRDGDPDLARRRSEVRQLREDQNIGAAELLLTNSAHVLPPGSRCR
jgi:hypothetical protein